MRCGGEVEAVALHPRGCRGEVAASAASGAWSTAVTLPFAASVAALSPAGVLKPAGGCAGAAITIGCPIIDEKIGVWPDMVMRGVPMTLLIGAKDDTACEGQPSKAWGV